MSRTAESFEHTAARHSTPLFRDLPGIGIELQRNKAVNLRLAARRLDGIVLEPGRRLSFWLEVGPPTRRRGFLEGMILRKGRIEPGVGGGLCQLTNLLYWMTLHTPLSVMERWRHGYDVFPDTQRTQPFGSGATCAWPALDLQIGNPTGTPFHLSVRLAGGSLEGCWTSPEPPGSEYRIEERMHRIAFEYPGAYVRSNELWRIARNVRTGAESESIIAENRALMMYQPLLESGAPTKPGAAPGGSPADPGDGN